MGDWIEFLGAAEQAAREAGRMLKEGMDARREVFFKGKVDLVTNFDRQAQEMIFDRLSADFPGHGFLAEEGLRREPEKDFLWVIDPLDGTTNYAHRFPIFCISIALQFRGRTVLGLVYDPMREEMFQAVEGKGGTLNGEKIRVSRVDDLDRSLLATGFPYDVRESRINNIDHFNDFVVRAQAVRRCGSAALDLCYVGCGRFDGFWELKLKPWDVAAAALVVKEAGGRLSDFDGAEFRIDGAEVLASNGLIHEAMIQVLQMGKARRLVEQKGGN
ncbi:MAG: inositol monophosphatase, partial [Candidatus Aminicenantes bacterium]|nr:inositol monophosphatase [Candidatus Aminicenantes bacterium]